MLITKCQLNTIQKHLQKKIFEELIEVCGDSKRPITLEDLPNLKYLERCIKESLRLYPPVHFISRSLDENVTLSKYYASLIFNLLIPKFYLDFKT